MKLKKGHIYRFHYNNYKHDPRPLALVLYSGKDKTHAINFNHLPKEVSKEFIDWITTIAINAKRMTPRDTYNLYHGYMKNRIPQVIRFAYRTYFTSKIKNVRKVSKGFFEIKNIFWKIK